MSLHLELKYLNLLNANIKSSNDKVIHLRCLVCGDSAKNKFKFRGYVLANDNISTVICHNCDFKGSFIKMLNEVDMNLATAYKREVFKDKLTNFSSKPKEDVFKIKENIKLDILKLGDTIELHGKEYSITLDLPQVAKDFISLRELTLDETRTFYYVNDLNALLIPFCNSNNEVYGYQIRLLERKQFYNVIPENNPKVYGLDIVESLSKGSKVYVFESIFDMMSSGIENSVAMIGATLSPSIIKEFFSSYDLIFCFDFDITGTEKAIKYSKLGFKVLVHDKKFPFKDFNEAEMSKVPRESIRKYILANVLSAKLANMKLRTRL